jgi:hypothetical protein
VFVIHQNAIEDLRDAVGPSVGLTVNALM